MTLIPLLLAVTLGQAFSPTLPWAPGGGKILASFPLSTTGALITEDANTVAHVYWNGTALVDTKGNSWTQNGTVPQVTANPFTTTRYGAGPFSLANFYSLGTGADVLDFAGDFTVCVVFAPNTFGVQYTLVIAGLAGASGQGWWMGQSGAGGVSFSTYGAASTFTASTVAASVVSGPSVACGGRIGSTQYLKVNLLATASTAGALAVPGTSYPSRIGTNTVDAQPGTIYEVYATSTAWNEATVTAIQQKVLGHFDGYSALAVTRTTNATYENPAGTVWTAAPGVARITADGLLVEPARTSYVKQSNTISTGAAMTLPWAYGGASVATVAGASVGGTWAELTSTAVSGFAYQTSDTSGATSTTWVGSSWIAKASGTGYAQITTDCGIQFATTCSCLRSDGGSCTANRLRDTHACDVQVSDLGTTPVRIAAIYTCGVAVANPALYLMPGQFGTATGTTRFSGAMLEIGTRASRR
jgi:hypothetical protein